MESYKGFNLEDSFFFGSRADLRMKNWSEENSTVVPLFILTFEQDGTIAEPTHALCI